MPRVICKLPNTSTLINGVKFDPHPDGGMVSEEIDEAAAKAFLLVPGYALLEPAAGGDKSGAGEKAAADGQEPEGGKPAEPAEPQSGTRSRRSKADKAAE